MQKGQTKTCYTSTQRHLHGCRFTIEILQSFWNWNLFFLMFSGLWWEPSYVVLKLWPKSWPRNVPNTQTWILARPNFTSTRRTSEWKTKTAKHSSFFFKDYYFKTIRDKDTWQLVTLPGSVPLYCTLIKGICYFSSITQGLTFFPHTFSSMKKLYLDFIIHYDSWSLQSVTLRCVYSFYHWFKAAFLVKPP